MKNKLLSYVGLAMRAGKLVSGDEGVLKAVRSGEAKLVLLADDASDKAKKKYKDKCGTYEVPVIECCTREELGSSIGKEERVVIAVTEAGFAKMIRNCTEKQAEVNRIE